MKNNSTNENEINEFLRDEILFIFFLNEIKMKKY